MKKYIPFILSIISCMVYCFCISLVNIYRPIEHMDISIGILLRLSVIVMFLTLLTGMLIVQFTFVYMGISALIYFTYISILWHFGKVNKQIKYK